MKKILIGYHKEDNDGLFSCAIMLNYMKTTMNNIQIETIGLDYNKAKIYNDNDYEFNLTFVNNFDIVCLLDFSLSSNRMIELYNQYENNFIWIDHHKPIIDKMNELGYSIISGLRMTNYSALALTYNWCYPFEQFNKKLPVLFNYLQAYDSWTYETLGLPFDDVNAINVGVQYETQLSLSKTMDIVNYIINKQLSCDENSLIFKKFLNIGDGIIKYNDKENERLIKDFGDTTWKLNNESACCVVISKPSNSNMFKCLEGSDIMHGIVCKRNKDSTWVISAYNIGNQESSMHVGNYLAKYYNGGGHKGAAGCQVTEEKMFEIFSKKEI